MEALSYYEMIIMSKKQIHLCTFCLPMPKRYVINLKITGVPQRNTLCSMTQFFKSEKRITRGCLLNWWWWLKLTQICLSTPRVIHYWTRKDVLFYMRGSMNAKKLGEPSIKFYIPEDITIRNAYDFNRFWGPGSTFRKPNHQRWIKRIKRFT